MDLGRRTAATVEFLLDHTGVAFLAAVVVFVTTLDARLRGQLPLSGLTCATPLLCAALASPVCTAAMTSWGLTWVILLFVVGPELAHQPLSAAAVWTRIGSVVLTGTAAVGLSARRRREVRRAYADLEARVQERTEELRSSQDRFRQLLEAAPDAMVIVAANGRISLVNRQTREVFGYESGELVGRPVEVLLPEGLRDGHRKTRLRYMRNPHVRPMGDGRELQARCKDGRQIPVEIRLSPLATERGTLVIAAIRDVSDRRLRAELLRESEERFRSVFEEAPVGIALVSVPDQIIVRANPAFSAIVGRPAAGLVGSPLPRFLHPADVRDQVRRFLAAVAGQPGTPWEPRCLRSDGEVVWTSAHVSVVRGAADQPDFAIVQLVDISERHRHEAQLAHLATHDPLTGLMNRNSFLTALDEHITRVARYGPSGAVVLLDLDGFKRVNDTYGHAVGDEVIVAVAQLLRQRLRAADMLARLGGDEFVVLIPTGDTAAVHVVAQDLVDQIRRHTVQAGGHAISLSASIGAAVFDSRRRTGAELLIDADLAMYEAKDNGRNRYVVFEPGRYDVPGGTLRLAWIDKLESAFRDDAFVLLAQPVVRLDTGAVRHYELLLRLRDEAGALVEPSSFLQVAERFGLIQRIDRWVIGRAGHLLGAAHRAGQPLTLAANVSGHSLADPALLDLIAATRHREHFPPQDLILEITETAAVANLPQARTFTQQLRRAGHRIALDDFGAGFGSFSYLKHLAFDFLKIDSEFVASCLHDRTDQVIIDALVNLSRHLGKQTIAEYVETDAVARYLSGCGVDYGQGYLFGKPADLPALLHPVR